MCNHDALIEWMAELPKEMAWHKRWRLVSYGFSFYKGGCKLTVRRENKRGTRQVTFIEDRTPRKCLRTLWADTTHSTGFLKWKESKY